MATALKIASLSKKFPGVKALDNVSFEVEEGTIHALLGENGAGKSTLIKIVSGRYTPDQGKISLFERDVRFSSPGEAQKAGISVVHQEINLVGTLTVAENIYLGRPYMKGMLVNWKTVREQAKKILDDIGINIETDRTVSSLSISEQQIVEICKALTNYTRIIIMDEPTASLTQKEIGILFNIIRSLKEKGITIIYISHRLDEVFEIADNLTVLRDGKHIDTRPVKGTDKPLLISLMVGRDLKEEFPKIKTSIGDTVLVVDKLSSQKKLSDISFYLKKGEILGIAGLVGSGRTELMRAILGIDGYDKGQVILNQKKVSFKKFNDAIQSGFAFVTEDRKRQGLILEMTVEKNITICAIKKIIVQGFLNRKKERELAKEYIDKLRILTPGLDTFVKFLSGGNQQKICIAKWLTLDSDIFIVDEPTRGIDVGAKAEIYKILNSLVGKGKSVIMISSELPELLGMCDRIYVMHEGKIKGELQRDEFSQQRILEMAIL